MVSRVRVKGFSDMEDSGDWLKKYPVLAALYAEMHPRHVAKLMARRCGAHSRRSGKPCQAQALANGRCRFHGGLSTGPKTQEGKARSMANLRWNRK